MPFASDAHPPQALRRRSAQLDFHACFDHRVASLGLTDLERELLELISMAGEPTTVLDEEMLESSPGRSVVEETLKGLLARGLISTGRAVNAGEPRRSDGERVYEDDWWELTAEAIRTVTGVPPTDALSVSSELRIHIRSLGPTTRATPYPRRRTL